MVLSKKAPVMYIALKELTNTIISSWDLRGVLLWSYLLPLAQIPQIELSSDESYLAFTGNNSMLYFMNLSTLSLSSK